MARCVWTYGAPCGQQLIWMSMFYCTYSNKCSWRSSSPLHSVWQSIMLQPHDWAGEPPMRWHYSVCIVHPPVRGGKGATVRLPCDYQCFDVKRTQGPIPQGQLRLLQCLPTYTSTQLRLFTCLSIYMLTQLRLLLWFHLFLFLNVTMVCLNLCI